MNRSLWMLWLAVVAVTSVALTVSGREMMAARNGARTRLIAFQGLTDRVREYDRLQARAERWPPRPTDTSLAQEVSAAMAAAGLPPSSLANLSPDTGTDVPGAIGLVRLRAGLTLNNITLPQVGRFLSEWRRRQPAPAPAGWTVTAIDLTPETGGDKRVGGDLPLRAVLSLEAIVAKGDTR
ncbi:MAG: hypothetical protein IT436_16060 [Phycisphaerales bacterium]|nr:hypothetical protein [Phycisphaerales bacterium]